MNLNTLLKKYNISISRQQYFLVEKCELKTDKVVFSKIELKKYPNFFVIRCIGWPEWKAMRVGIHGAVRLITSGPQSIHSAGLITFPTFVRILVYEYFRVIQFCIRAEGSCEQTLSYGVLPDHSAILETLPRTSKRPRPG